MKIKDGYKMGECDSCTTENIPVIETDHRFLYNSAPQPEKIKLCELCYCTFASKPFLYPDNSIDLGEVIKIIVQVGNIIRQDISNL